MSKPPVIHDGKGPTGSAEEVAAHVDQLQRYTLRQLRVISLLGRL